MSALQMGTLGEAEHGEFDHAYPILPPWQVLGCLEAQRHCSGGVGKQELVCSSLICDEVRQESWDVHTPGHPGAIGSL